jgi:phosphoribosyl 1,2-cyclic phosphate phosphodiesterase
MQLTFLGTGADTSYPLAFCHCEICTHARTLGGRNIRKRSSLLVNDDLLIDLGPDAVQAGLMYGHSFADLDHVLITHAHSDHFDPSHLNARHPDYGNVGLRKLHFYASELSLRRMSSMMQALGFGHELQSAAGQAEIRVEVNAVAPMQTFEVGQYIVTAFEANHDDSIQALIYSIQSKGKTVLYATDTNTLSEETWAGFRSKGIKFDAVIMDHAYGPGADGNSHLNAPRFQETLARLKAEGLLLAQARIFATHLSHEGNMLHSELSAYAAAHGYEIPWDGLSIQI